MLNQLSWFTCPTTRAMLFSGVDVHCKPLTGMADRAKRSTVWRATVSILTWVFAVSTATWADTPYPSLRESFDAGLQSKLERLVDNLGFTEAARSKKLNLALVDLSDPGQPRVAAINGDEMVYAASLPKLAILLGAMVKVEQGELTLDRQTEASLQRMMQVSSNRDATQMLNRIGKEELASILSSDRFRLYDPTFNGGLWVGKDYGKRGLWQRDPLHNLSHGATALQTARLYYLMETGQLFGGRLEPLMKGFLADPKIPHKFVKGLGARPGEPRIYRKSGTWRTWHSDSALVEREGHKYILVALANHPNGGRWLERIAAGVDALITSTRPAAKTLSPNPSPASGRGE